MVIIQLFGLEERQRNNYFSGQSRYLTAGDVHVPGPLSEFKVCKSCFGSVAPTCKKNKQCLAEKAFAFDPNQPRDERGRWADVLGVGGKDTNRPVKEKQHIRQQIEGELDRVAQNPTVSKALDQLEKVHVHTHVRGGSEPGGLFSPSGTVRHGLTTPSVKDYEVGNRIFMWPYRRGQGLIPDSAPLQLSNENISASTLQGTLRHEVGHLVHYRALPDGQKNVEWLSVYEKIKADPDKYVVGGRSGFKTRGWSRVSGYANTNHTEAFAESFTAYTHSDYRKGMLPPEVEGFMDKHIGRQGFGSRGYTIAQRITVLFGTPETGWVTADVEEDGNEYREFAVEENGVWRTVRGRRVFIREGETPTQAIKRSITERSARAIQSYIPATKTRQDQAAKYEATVAKLIGGKNLDDHEPFDVIKGQHAVEVKAILPGGAKSVKVTMHPESLARKEQFLRKTKMTGHTVVIDARGDKPIYYHKVGVGSFRLSNMQMVKSTELKGLIT